MLDDTRKPSASALGAPLVFERRSRGVLLGVGVSPRKATQMKSRPRSGAFRCSCHDTIAKGTRHEPRHTESRLAGRHKKAQRFSAGHSVSLIWHPVLTGGTNSRGREPERYDTTVFCDLRISIELSGGALPLSTGTFWVCDPDWTRTKPSHALRDVDMTAQGGAKRNPG